MNNCCLSLVASIFSASTFEPLILCSATNPILVNERALELFEYQSKEEFLQLTNDEMIQKHFSPSKVKDEVTGNIRKARIMNLCFANVKNYKNVRQTAVVKVKDWKIEDQTYYSIGIRDIPLIKVIPEKGTVQVIDRINESNQDGDKSELSIIDPTSEPELDKRLLHEFSQMADTLPSMIWIMGNQGDVHYQNTKVLETFGVNTISEGWGDCIHPDDVQWFYPMWSENFQKRATFSLEVRYGNQNRLHSNENYSYDDYRWHFFQATPILNEKGHLLKYIVNAVDIHDLKEAEEEKQSLIALEKLAIESSKLKSAFLSMMSHEIRTPLFGIVGNTCLLLDTEISELQKEYIENIDGSAKLMMAVVQDILDFSRIEAGKLELNLEPFSLKRSLNLFVTTVKKAAERKKINFEYKIVEEEMKAIGDSMRILQILINVTSNAIKFTDQGTVKFDMNHFLDENNKRNLSFSIIDTGIGIEPDILPKLFTPWVQGDSSNRRLFGGSGLGLAITKSLLDMMEGDIMIESTVGKGTKVSLNFKIDSLSPDFNVESPRSQTSSPVGESKFEFYTLYESPVVIQKTGIKKEEKPAVDGPKKKLNNSKLNKLKNNRKIKKAEAEKSVSSNRIRLLLAEDNPINQAILKRFLDKMGGVDYFLAVDGEMALNEYNSHPVGYYDIILLDQSMPKMDGDTVCQKIREIDQEQIIISVSANTLLSDRKYHQSIGMNDHISKPVTYNTFQNVLTKWLNQLNNNNDTTNNTNNNNNNNISALNLNAPIAASSV